MRLFITVRFPEEVLDGLEKTQREMRQAGIRGRYAPRENLHLTLAFIGEYADPGYVAETMEKVRSAPFRLKLAGTGSFGSILWAGLERSEPLLRYTKSLRHFLAEAEIPFDRKKFSPHITLARDASIPSDVRFGEDFMRLENDTAEVGFVSLMKSERGKNGMIYTELAAVPLTEDKYI